MSNRLNIQMPPGIRVDACRHGLFASIEGDTHIGRSLQAYGEWSEGEVALLSQILRPGDVVVDAGANIGAHAIPFARKVGPEGRVFAFEPQPRIHDLLTVNAFMNGLGNVVPILAGLGAAPGHARFPDRLEPQNFNFGGIRLDPFIKNRIAGDRHVQIPIGPLDEMLDLDRLRLIKADVEHMELDLIKGAARTIERHQPVVLLENGDPAETDSLTEAMAPFGYQGYWLAEFIYRRNNHRGNPENLFGTQACCNILFAPKSFHVKQMRPVEGPESHPFVKPKPSDPQTVTTGAPAE
ncbi:MAG: FkbM family methyltransferase [Pseudomonadota bacterium]